MRKSERRRGADWCGGGAKSETQKRVLKFGTRGRDSLKPGRGQRQQLECNVAGQENQPHVEQTTERRGGISAAGGYRNQQGHRTDADHADTPGRFGNTAGGKLRKAQNQRRGEQTDYIERGGLLSSSCRFDTSNNRRIVRIRSIPQPWDSSR